MSGGVEALAHAAAVNTVAAARWLDANGGATLTRAHPAYADVLDPSSPVGSLVEAQDALTSACRRYRLATGQNGVAMARRVIEASYNPAVAAAALRPLEAPADFLDALFRSNAGMPAQAAELPHLTPEELTAAIDDLLSDEPEPVPPDHPTPEEWQAGRSAVADWMLGDPELDGLAERLGALLSTFKAAAEPNTDHAFAVAVAALLRAVGDALARGFECGAMQAVLDCWSAATGGPRICVPD